MVDKALFEAIVAANHPDDESGDGAATEGTTQQTTDTATDASATGTGEGGEAGDATGAAADTGTDEPAGSTEAVTLTGHDRTIVKAARAAERRAQARVRELEAELAARPVPEAEKPYVPDAVVLEQLEELDPKAAAMLRQAAENQGKPAAAASAPAEPEFVPEAFEDEAIQDAIDATPELLAWQTDATKQGEWRRAKAMDKFLSLDPVWSQKPLEDRLAETVRRCKADGAAPAPSKPTAADAQKVIAAKAEETPLSVGDLRGRTPQTQRPSRRAAWATMSKEAILNTLEE